MNIFLTLDYELFLGQNAGTVNNSLIVPIRYFNEVLDRYGIHSTVFVDAAYLLALERLMQRHDELKRDFYEVSQNILLLSNSLHDVQMHFHPQWLFSDYKFGRWKLDYSHYKLSDMPKQYLNETFAEAKKLLESIIGHNVVAFRAGGYSLTTLNDYSSFLISNGISVDSSVLRRCRMSSYLQSYDYTNVPEKSVYHFSKSVTEEDILGKLTELSISTVPMNNMLYILESLCMRRKYKSCGIWGDGVGVGYGNIQNNFYQKLKKFFKISTSVPATLDGFAVDMLPSIYKRFASYVVDDNFVAIGHPKTMSKMSLKSLDFFLKSVSATCNFLTIRDWLNK